MSDDAAGAGSSGPGSPGHSPPDSGDRNGSLVRSLRDTGVLAPAWWPQTLRIHDEVGDLLEMAAASPNDYIEMLMVERIVTIEWLTARGGPVSIAAWVNFCRERGIPNFEPGVSVRASFQRFTVHSVDDVVHDSNASPVTPSVERFVDRGVPMHLIAPVNRSEAASHSPPASRAEQTSPEAPAVQAPASVPGARDFIRYMSEVRFSGSPNTIPFRRWRNRLESAREMFGVNDAQVARALPLITSGQAESLLYAKARELPRLSQKLSLLEKSFASAAAMTAQKQALKSANFAVFVSKESTRVLAFDALVRHVEDVCSFLGYPYDEPGQVADHVIQAMYASDYAPTLSLALIGTRDGADVIAELRVFLHELDARNGRLLPAATGIYYSRPSASFQHAPQPSARPPQGLPYRPPTSSYRPPVRNRSGNERGAQVCQHCGRMGHSREICWSRNPPAVGLVLDEVQEVHDTTTSGHRVAFEVEPEGDVQQIGVEGPDPREPEQDFGGNLVAFAYDVYRTQHVLPTVPRWRVFVDSGAGRSVAGWRAYTEYCRAQGKSSKLAPAGGEQPVNWGGPLSPVGVGRVRIPVGKDHFVEFNPVVVDNDDLPILFGGQDQDQHHFDLIRTTDPPRLSSPSFSVPLRRLHSGHLEVVFPSQGGAPSLLDTALYTSDELMTLHKRFGHASAHKVRKIINLAGERIEPSEFRKFEDDARNCTVCQWYQGRRTTYKVAAEINVEFNHVVQMDFVFIVHNGRNIKVLHAVCAGTKWNAAIESTDGTAPGVFSDFFRMWVSIFGAPHRLVVDREKVLDSNDLEVMFLNEGCILDPVAIESHWSVGYVERHHEPLRKVCSRIMLEDPSAQFADVLSFALRAINTTTGPENIIPSLLVFGTIPRIHVRSEAAIHDSRESQERRITAMLVARNEYEVLVSKMKLAAARRTRTPQYPGDNDALVPGAAVLVRRENDRAWTGPYVCHGVDGTRAQVSVLMPSQVSSDRARVAAFSVNNVKLYRAPTSPALICLWAQTCTSAEDVLWENADRKEMQGILARDVIRPVDRVPKGATILGSRFERVVKVDGTRKSRFVVQGFRDVGAANVNVHSPVLSKYSLRLLISVARIRNNTVEYRDYAQAYLQSDFPLARAVYLRLKPEVRQLLSTLTDLPDYPEYVHVVRPLYGLTESGTYWYATLRKAFEREGFKVAALDACVMYLHGHGAVGILVDDTILVGDDFARRAESRVSARYDNKGLSAPPFSFNGFRVLRHGDNYTLDHHKYVRDNLSTRVVRDYKEFQQVRGQLAYVATGTRPDILCAVAQLSQVTTTTFTHEHARLLRAACRQVTDFPRCLFFNDLRSPFRLRVYADASYASNPDHTSQIGFAIFLGDDSENAHLIHAQSNKSRQVAHSVLSAELLALCIAFDFAEAVQLELLAHGLSVPIVLATDSKQIFDSITKSSVLAEKRLMVRMLVLRQGLEDLRISQVLHVPGASNIADALTKNRACALWDRFLREGKLAHVHSASVYLVE
ncbi:Transposon Ty1-OR Gag-Pol polyprotein [Porphyridium purpureum]|uniref:Transposon Ty1-OR Gag-Pol polyprotein n=1 Tax=Porphyridium purpureum TaxID=35688 RepID=A0A5J4Z6F7_PORPP|nr:Transposon Ty1-OR Gag-Pol polyprotein [Porphyridium purpureum]|eukprot:POR9219..scf295_1